MSCRQSVWIASRQGCSTCSCISGHIRVSGRCHTGVAQLCTAVLQRDAKPTATAPDSLWLPLRVQEASARCCPLAALKIAMQP